MPGPSRERWAITTLGDLTGQTTHAHQALPRAWVEWLPTQFPDTELIVETPAPTPGQLDMLLPRTTVVLRVGYFTKSALRVVGYTWVLAMASSASVGGSLLLAAVALLDQYKELLAAFVQLDEEKGEHCTYVAVLGARTEALRSIDVYPDREQIWDAHQQVREYCPVVGCLHHRDGCQAARGDIDVVVERLLGRGALVAKQGGMWPTR